MPFFDKKRPKLFMMPIKTGGVGFNPIITGCWWTAQRPTSVGQIKVKMICEKNIDNWLHGRTT